MLNQFNKFLNFGKIFQRWLFEKKKTFQRKVCIQEYIIHTKNYFFLKQKKILKNVCVSTKFNLLLKKKHFWGIFSITSKKFSVTIRKTLVIQFL